MRRSHWLSVTRWMIVALVCGGLAAGCAQPELPANPTAASINPPAPADATLPPSPAPLMTEPAVSEAPATPTPTPTATPLPVDGWLGTIVQLDAMAQYDDGFQRADGERYGIDGSAAGLAAEIEDARRQGAGVRVWGYLLTDVPDVNGRQIVAERLQVISTPDPAAVTTTPITTGASIEVSGWSPDGEWLAFWRADDGAPAKPYPVMTLHFYNARTGEACHCPELQTRPMNMRPLPLTWTDDGQVIVWDGQTAQRGAPCRGSFHPTDEAPPADAASLSPGGSYRAATREEPSGDVQRHVTTTLSDARSGRVVQVVEYTHPGGEGGLGLGGMWLTDRLFLISETLDRGPLLVDVPEGRVTAVMRELFGLQQRPSADLRFYAWGQTVAGSGAYHILLGGLGVEPACPPLRLYHSETGQAEELALQFPGPGPFSPDGRWLLLSDHPRRPCGPLGQECESCALWARPVDPPGAAAQRVAEGDCLARWSPDWKRVAMASLGRWYGLPNVTTVYSFPEGAALRSWATGDYLARPAAWSPDGKRLALWGSVMGEWKYALFIVEP